MRNVFWPLLATLAIASTQALGQGAPKALHNKSITASFGIAQALKGPDGRIINPGFSREFHIYISSAGRLFVKSTGSSAGGSRLSQSRHRGPGESSWRFQGNQMVGAIALASGATRSVVTFGSGFTSCTLAVMFGKEDGKAIRVKGIDGVEREVLSMNAVHPSCKIQDGNVFAR